MGSQWGGEDGWIWELHPRIPAHRGVLGAGGDDVLNEGVPLDVQHISLVTTNFGIVWLDPASLEWKSKENIGKIIKFWEKLVFPVDGELLEKGDLAQPGMGQARDWVYPTFPVFPADLWMGRGFSRLHGAGKGQPGAHKKLMESWNTGLGKVLQDHGVQPFPALIHVPKGCIHRDFQSLWEWGQGWKTLSMREFSQYPNISFHDPNP